MKITNKLNLPSVIVKACTNDTYQRGSSDFTVTELLQPPRLRALRRKHEAELTEDVSDVLYRLCGSIGHGIIERAGLASKVCPECEYEKRTGEAVPDGIVHQCDTDNQDIVEKRFKASFTVDGKEYTLSGQADLVRDGSHKPFSIWDWKFTSQYAFKDGVKPEYVAQLNMLKLLCFMADGIQAANLFSVPIYRDWSKNQAGRDGYPSTQIEVFPVANWGKAKTEAFIAERIRLHVAAETNLPECGPEDRWASPDTWAIKKAGNKRAHRVYTTPEEAATEASKNGMIVEPRRGKSVRCENYCQAAPFCEQWKRLKEQEGGSEE